MVKWLLWAGTKCGSRLKGKMEPGSTGGPGRPKVWEDFE